MKNILKVTQLLTKGAAAVSFVKQYVPQEVQDAAMEKITEVVAKGKAVGVEVLENYAPDVVKDIVDRNAPKAPTAKEIAAEVKKALNPTSKKAAEKSGPKKTK